MGAITRVFASRWLPTEPGGINVVMGLDCADLTAQGERFKLYRALGTTATYELDTASGEMMGRISFDKLSDVWQTPYTGAYVIFYGLAGAVCDGPAAPHEIFYAPGRCMANYASVRYAINVQPAIRASECIYANLCSPAEILRPF